MSRINKLNLKEYLLDWDWDTNTSLGITPEDITIGSRKRVFWKCHICGGSWNTQMKERRGCPFCTRFKALPKFNDLMSTNPEVAAEWDYDKNTLVPQHVTSGSKRKVYWKCPNKHSYLADIYSRVRGEGCPYCINKRVLQGYNDLETVNPKLASEWHPLKNKHLRPYDFVAGSKVKVWWICKEGHAWMAQIAHRNKGRNCPVCANRIILKNFNDFASAHLDLVDEWDYIKNQGQPFEYGSHSRKKVWWICKKGHSFQSVISDRSKGTDCPKCSEERRVSFPEKTILFYLQKSIENIIPNYRNEAIRPYELDIYIPQLKVAIEYDGIYGHSSKEGVARDKRKNFVCENCNIRLIRIRETGCPALNSTSIDYELSNKDDMPNAIHFIVSIINKISENRVTFNHNDYDIAKDAGEIYSLIEFSEKENSLPLKAPDIVKLWHPTKNGNLKPEYTSIGSQKKVWWLGSCGHEWRSIVSYEVSSGKCPYCTGKRVLKGYNDLPTTNPKLASEWNYEMNQCKPESYTGGSGKVVYWICAKNGHSWKASIVSRNRGNGCPICANRVLLKGFNDIGSIPRISKDWNCVKNGSVIKTEVCIGTSNKYWWKCNLCGHEWFASVNDRFNGSTCPSCVEKTRIKTFNKTLIWKKGSLKDTRPDLMEEWNFELNQQTNPNEIVAGYGKKVWWKCKKCDNIWAATVISRKNGRGCPECAKIQSAIHRRKKLLESKQSLSITHPDIAQEWALERNGNLSPENVTAGSGKRVWWRCKICAHEWNAVIGERTRGRCKCSKCSVT